MSLAAGAAMRRLRPLRPRLPAPRACLRRRAARCAASAPPGAAEAPAAEAAAPAGPVVLLDVTQMRCAGCSAAVRRVLETDERVAAASVNLVTGLAAATLAAAPGSGDTAAVNESLAEIVSAKGFPATPRSQAARRSLAEAAEEAEARRREQGARRRGRHKRPHAPLSRRAAPRGGSCARSRALCARVGVEGRVGAHEAR